MMLKSGCLPAGAIFASEAEVFMNGNGTYFAHNSGGSGEKGQGIHQPGTYTYAVTGGCRRTRR